ncbi:hypothetical protein BBJ28_00006221 [Nothophytophthora sp. Chile5]|nr:hypothetical protein BBJ28_00006221 [Nothophytophthora sp. Chile5]
MDGYDHLFKLLLIGDAGVGKSSCAWWGEPGVDFKVKMMQVDGKKIKMTIWDTAGQERFRTLTSSYYRGAQGIVLVVGLSHMCGIVSYLAAVYDVARRDTFENLDLWLQEVEVYSPAGGRDVVKLLVGNKIDKERVVSRREAEDWARSKGMLFVESSAKTKIGIQQVFNEVVQKTQGFFKKRRGERVAKQLGERKRNKKEKWKELTMDVNKRDKTFRQKESEK